MGCRQEDERAELVRLVLFDGAVHVDYRAKLPGRGAWVHPRAACVAGVDAPALSRAFKAAVKPDGVREAIHDAALRAALDGISLAAAGGAIYGGFDVLKQALAEGRIVLVAVANDASPRTIERLRRVDPEVPFVDVPLSGDELGTRVGRPNRAALGFPGSGTAVQAVRQLSRLHDLRAQTADRG